MAILDTILARRSVRQYTDEPVPEETLKSILFAGLAAPTSKNRRPWEFVVVRDRDMLSRLGECRPSAGNLLGKCHAAIVVMADSEAVDVWVEDCAAAMTQMHLAASALGVGSCWLQVRLRTTPDGMRATQDVIRELLDIPDRFSILSILTLGMPAAEIPPHTLEELPLEKIHYHHF